jgi:Protein of unknown function (DUF3102)
MRGPRPSRPIRSCMVRSSSFSSMIALRSSERMAVCSVWMRSSLFADEIQGHWLWSNDAIEIGRLLTERKEQLGHGQWLSWLEL